MIDLEASVGTAKAGMGDELTAANGSDASVQASMKAPAGRSCVLLDGKPLANATAVGAPLPPILPVTASPTGCAPRRAQATAGCYRRNPVYLNRPQR